MNLKGFLRGLNVIMYIGCQEGAQHIIGCKPTTDKNCPLIRSEPEPIGMPTVCPMRCSNIYPSELSGLKSS